jgi:hypothetical protein
LSKFVALDLGAFEDENAPRVVDHGKGVHDIALVTIFCSKNPDF